MQRFRKHLTIVLQPSLPSCTSLVILYSRKSLLTHPGWAKCPPMCSKPLYVYFYCFYFCLVLKLSIHNLCLWLNCKLLYGNPPHTPDGIEFPCYKYPQFPMVFLYKSYGCGDSLVVQGSMLPLQGHRFDRWLGN